MGVIPPPQWESLPTPLPQIVGTAQRDVSGKKNSEGGGGQGIRLPLFYFLPTLGIRATLHYLNASNRLIVSAQKALRYCVNTA